MIRCALERELFKGAAFAALLVAHHRRQNPRSARLEGSLSVLAAEEDPGSEMKK